MAYVPKDDSQQESESTMQVYGSGQQQGESAQDMGSTSTTNTSGMSTGASAISPQGSQQPQQGGIKMGPMNQQTPGPKPAPKQEARSGMFTNIRKYVQANQPKAQQMGQKVSQGFQQKTGDVRGQFEQQQSQFQQQVNQNRQRMQEAEQFGQQQIQQAANATAQPSSREGLIGVSGDRESWKEQDRKQREYEASTWRADDKFMEEYEAIMRRVHPMDHGPNSSNERSMKNQQEDLKKLFAQYGYSQNMPTSPQQDNVKRFQQLTSDQAGFGDIGYDVGAQQREAQELQRSAESLNKEEGLRRGLQSTFGAGREAYTQGMSGLDQMILGTNRNVREQMAGSAQESAKQLTGDIGQARTQALRDLSQLELGGTQLAKSLKETLGSKQEDIRRAALDAQSRGVAMKEELKQFLAGKKEGISQSTADALGISAGQSIYGLNQDNLGSSSIGSFLDQDSRARLSALQDLAGQKDQMLASSQGQDYESQEAREARMRGAIEEKTAAFEQESRPIVDNINYLNKGISDMQTVYAQPDMYTKRIWMNHPLIRPYWDGNEDLSAYNGALSRAMGAANAQRSSSQSNLDSLKRNYFESGPIKIVE